MYFDDVSPRYSTRRWKPGKTIARPVSTSADSLPFMNRNHGGCGNKKAIKRSAEAATGVEAVKQEWYQTEKQALLRKFLIGYNATTASELDDSEIERQTLFWAKESGVVGNYFGDELYHDVLGTSISHATNLAHCVADVWQFIRLVVLQYKDNGFATVRNRWLFRSEQSHVYFCVFSHCTDAYDYKTFTALVAALEFCKDICVHMGKDFSVTLFHPKFKNSPTLLSPERHSPFPTIALQFGPVYRAEQDRTLSIFSKSARKRRRKMSGDKESQKSSGGPSLLPPMPKSLVKRPELLPPPDAPDEELGHLVDARITDLEGTRAHFEVLFNSAAASGQHDDVWTHPPLDEGVDGGERERGTEGTEQAQMDALFPSHLTEDDRPILKDSLAWSFQQERKRRRRDIPAHCAHQHIEEWASNARRTAHGKTNTALLFWDAQLLEGDDAWVVCSEKMAEHVYAAIWATIQDLYECCSAMPHQDHSVSIEQQSPKGLHRQDGRPVGTGQGDRRRFHLGDWMNTLSASESSANSIPSQEVRSRVFVTPKFMPYNAQGFKRFAITVNAALKRFTNRRMFMEVFHPEYVGNKGYHHGQRRSPYPMIQICCRVADEQDKK